MTGTGCVDINECRGELGHPVCTDKSEYCINTAGSFHCGCRPGYQERPDKQPGCVDINECEYPSMNTCDPSQICHNKPGGYECVCKDPNHIKDPVTKACKPFNMCTDGGGAFDPCDKATSYCVFDQIQGPMCVCKEGFKPKDDYTCEDINECEDEAVHQCPALISTCVNVPGTYKCQCDEVAGYTQDPTNPRLLCTNLNECVKWPGICGDFPCCLDLPPSFPPKPFSGFLCARTLSDSLESNPFMTKPPPDTPPTQPSHYVLPTGQSHTPSSGLRHVPPPPQFKADVYQLRRHAETPKFIPLASTPHTPQTPHTPYTPHTLPTESYSLPVIIKASDLPPDDDDDDDNNTFTPRTLLAQPPSVSQRLHTAAALVNAVPTLNSNILNIGKLLQLNVGQCPKGYLNTHELIRNTAYERTATLVADSVATALHLNPIAVAKGVTENSEIAAEDVARWVKALTMTPMGLMKVAQNLTSELNNTEIFNVVRLGALLGESVTDGAKRLGSLFTKAANIRDQLEMLN
eukprot:Blabericola_migrator_1__4746@NODE_24_length_21460_cov_93_666994_g21_i0_p5_GENE_NODE_24_length_21460_cov_93_666994_g21_i0NODE_24_length_21460_cov_93_666994_g21_i0_p5_ORF_typecomplete_len519_score97_05EGF_CA/PF07645_15/4_6e10EGF_CA/PF07645_15/2_7e09EGF_CA/PF07645_15/12EGF_CA/PF07645_15/1_2e08EGF_CA/PF07645_15/37EGF_CA/PF07645_15/1_9e03FXa_inhibition/PF14670_6/1_3e05FXa_inhibition/PF14670_6/0_0032FXa_inhibition/PF14670_6/2_4e02FXa_inhibition/PF14670_6/0_053FXa_inhibition/PF14670_6/4_9e03EGF_3/PF129